MDIKTAFLNAPLQTLQESSKKKAMALEDAHGRHQEDIPPQGQEEQVEGQSEQGPEQRKRLALMLPPKLLIRLGLAKEGEVAGGEAL